MTRAIVRWADSNMQTRREVLARPVQSRSAAIEARVGSIVNGVRAEGDAALRRLTRELDGVSLSSFEVSAEEESAARESISREAAQAIKEAIARIETFHRAQMQKPIDVETAPGVRCERRFVPVSRVGLYVPGGSAPLVSTAIMLGVPAKIAGCKVRILITPPRKDGTIDPHILFAAEALGIEQIFKLGGAQAIAALAYGTESVPKVDKIFGPGNSYVTEAKLLVAHDPAGAAIDLPAGPSEVLVIADGEANPAFVAADLLSQAEHGEDSHVVLVSDSRTTIEATLQELESQLARLPRRAIAQASLARAAFIEAADLNSAISISNAYAPEHLILQVRDARALAARVEHAGSVFIGAFSPEAAGDYASGTNHVLPTYGAARAFGGLSVESFMKAITFQELSREGLRAIAPVVETLARLEGLEAHRNAISIRVRALEDSRGAR